jgi:hypothetical protein
LSAAAGTKTEEIRGFPARAPDRVCPVTANPGRNERMFETIAAFERVIQEIADNLAREQAA